MSLTRPVASDVAEAEPASFVPVSRTGRSLDVDTAASDQAAALPLVGEGGPVSRTARRERTVRGCWTIVYVPSP